MWFSNPFDVDRNIKYILSYFSYSILLLDNDKNKKYFLLPKFCLIRVLWPVGNLNLEP